VQVAAGVGADGRQIVNRAVEECTNYKEYADLRAHIRWYNAIGILFHPCKFCRFYGEPMPGHVLAERLGAYLHLFNLYGYLRPFGTAHLMATRDEFNGHALFLLETSGVANRFYGTAVGKHRQAAKTEIEKLDLNTLTCREALQHVAKMFVTQRDDAKPYDLEMGWLTEENGWVYQAVPIEMVKQAEAAAKAQVDDADMDDA
jgi:20S proteasome subunit alpha 7